MNLKALFATTIMALSFSTVALSDELFANSERGAFTVDARKTSNTMFLLKQNAHYQFFIHNPNQDMAMQFVTVVHHRYENDEKIYIGCAEHGEKNDMSKCDINTGSEGVYILTTRNMSDRSYRVQYVSVSWTGNF